MAISLSQSACDGPPLSDAIAGPEADPGARAGVVDDLSGSRNMDVLVPPGRRSAMTRFLLCLRERMAEQGMDQIAADIDAAFAADGVDGFLGRLTPVDSPALLITAIELGRKGGRKGGKARAARLSPQQRSEAARLAAQARWNRRKRQ